MKNKQKNSQDLFLHALFWGSLWGIAEATVGYFLHCLHIPGLAGFLMFPVGVFFMLKAFTSSGRLSSMFLTSLVAAHIKLLDLFLPTPTVFTVINPAAAMISESLAVTIFLAWKGLPRLQTQLTSLWAVSLSWRLLYGTWAVFLGFLFPIQNILDLNLLHNFRFFLLESLANGVLLFHIFMFIALKKRHIPRVLRTQPVFASFLIFLAAALLELMI
jgi:hypothetical protein